MNLKYRCGWDCVSRINRQVRRFPAEYFFLSFFILCAMQVRNLLEYSV